MVIKITESKPSCEARYILQTLGSIKQEANKLDYLKDTLERCTVFTTPKRKLSGYNCFIKVAIKKSGKPLKEVVKAKTWSTLEAKQKSHWVNLANEGCNNPRLWET